MKRGINGDYKVKCGDYFIKWATGFEIFIAAERDGGGVVEMLRSVRIEIVEHIVHARMEDLWFAWGESKMMY